MTVEQVLPSCSEHMAHLALPLIVTSLSPANALVALKARSRVVTPTIVANIFFIVSLFLFGLRLSLNNASDDLNVNPVELFQLFRRVASSSRDQLFGGQ